MRVARMYVVGAAAALVAAIGIAAAATVDHSREPRDTHREWVALWTCNHYHVRCGEQTPGSVGWHRREPYYNWGFGASLSVAAVLGIAAISRRRAGVLPPRLQSRA